jgi:hypothetical protein
MMEKRMKKGKINEKEKEGKKRKILAQGVNNR